MYILILNLTSFILVLISGIKFHDLFVVKKIELLRRFAFKTDMIYGLTLIRFECAMIYRHYQRINNSEGIMIFS